MALIPLICSDILEWRSDVATQCSSIPIVSRACACPPDLVIERGGLSEFAAPDVQALRDLLPQGVCDV